MILVKNIFFSIFLLLNCSISSNYLNNLSDFFYSKKTIHVGYISIEGKIERSEEIYFTLKRLEQDASIDAIIISIDSQGGFTGSGHRIADIIKRVAKKKPVVAYAVRDMVSAAYNLASTCSWIVAHATAAIGGIGTVIYIPKKNDTITIGSGKFKNVAYASEGVLEAEYAEYIQGRINTLGAAGCQFVADHRGLSFEFVKSLESKYYIAHEALELGLIDQVGEFEDALFKIAELLSIQNGKAYTKINLMLADGTFLAKYDI